MANDVFDPGNGRMTVEGDNSVYIAEPYKVIFKKQELQSTSQNMPFYIISVMKEDKPLASFMLYQRVSSSGTNIQLYYSLDRCEKVTDETFWFRNYSTFPDLQVLAVHSINYAINYEKELIGHGIEEFTAAKEKIVQHIRNLYPDSKFFFFQGYVAQFIVFTFVPIKWRYDHYIGCAYDIKEEKYNFLTINKSLELFFDENRIELAGDNKRWLSADKVEIALSFFKKTGVNFYDKIFISSYEDLIKSPYVSEENKEAIKQKTEGFKDIIKPAYYNEDSVIFYTMDRYYPSCLSEWKITEKDGKFKITQKILADKFYFPDFLSKDIAKEEKLEYFR